jgi:hypothetical protein
MRPRPFVYISFPQTFSRERKAHPVWFFTPQESYRLTEDDITEFVHCIKEYAIISIFNKNHADEAAKACQCLSILRPELIVPLIIEKFDILILFFIRSLIHFPGIFCRSIV